MIIWFPDLKNFTLSVNVYVFCKDKFVYLVMYLIEIANHRKHQVKVELLDEDDYKQITKTRYYFNWKTEKEYSVYKLICRGDILGLMSCLINVNEQRIEIKLLAVSKENRGGNKEFDRIAGTLIGFACREAMKLYGKEACVSLVPKTKLKQHYIDRYGMLDAGWQVFLVGGPLLEIIKEYYEK